jgi:hypothetical protein
MRQEMLGEGSRLWQALTFRQLEVSRLEPRLSESSGQTNCCRNVDVVQYRGAALQDPQISSHEIFALSNVRLASSTGFYKPANDVPNNDHGGSGRN